MLVLCGFGLVSAGLAAFCVMLCCYLLVSAGLAASCVVLGWSLLVSPYFVWFCIVLGWSNQFVQIGPRAPVKSDITSFEWFCEGFV